MARDKLQKFRKSIHKTQEEMANAWEITLSFYKKIEHGSRNPSIRKIRTFKKKFPEANTEEIFLS